MDHHHDMADTLQVVSMIETHTVQEPWMLPEAQELLNEPEMEVEHRKEFMEEKKLADLETPIVADSEVISEVTLTF